MAKAPSGVLDDSYRAISISDFSGGQVNTPSPLALGSNQSPGLLNCIHLPGRLIFRGGYQNFCVLPGPADAAYPFFDTTGAKHYVVWSNGNVYDCVSGVTVLVEAAVYTAGQRIGTVDLNGILYWSTGQPNPVPLRFWNPPAGTKGAVPNAGGAGVVAPPASDFLFLYLNAIVALAPTWGAGPVYQRNVFAWCNTNDPSTWVGANSQAVGPTNNGRLEYGRPFGIAEVGVVPFENIMIARNDFGVYVYSGALGALHESLLNCPVGMKDRDSAQYLPTSGNFGAIVWLGTDGQLWSSNGINAQPISNDILPVLSGAYNYTLANNPGARFFSGYNQQWQYYWVDIGGTQYVYRWASNSWTVFNGWPSGPSFSTVDATGVPAYFIASNIPSSVNLSQIGITGVADNGVMPVVRYSSPILHGGNFNIFKDFHWVSIASLDTGGQYKISATSVKRSNGDQMTANSLTLVAPSVAGTGHPFIIGKSLLGGPDLLTLALPPGAGTPVVMQGRFAVPIPEDLFMPAGHFETLKGNGIQVIVEYAGGQPVFDLLGVGVLYVPKGYRGGSGAIYNPEDLTGQAFDPFSMP